MKKQGQEKNGEPSARKKRSLRAKVASAKTRRSEEDATSDPSEMSQAKKPDTNQKDDVTPVRPVHPNSKEFDIPYYSRNRNDHGSGQFGGHGYTSRGGYGRRQ